MLSKFFHLVKSSGRWLWPWLHYRANSPCWLCIIFWVPLQIFFSLHFLPYDIGCSTSERTRRDETLVPWIYLPAAQRWNTTMPSLTHNCLILPRSRPSTGEYFFLITTKVMLITYKLKITFYGILLSQKEKDLKRSL